MFEEELREYAELMQMIKKSRLYRVRDILRAYMMDSIRIRPERLDDSQIKLGKSKMGGMPDLPLGMQWPGSRRKRLAFVAQLNLEDLNELDKTQVLPLSGWLYFFYDNEKQPWGLQPKDREHWRVLYYNGELKSLRRTDFPVTLSTNSRFHSCLLGFKREITLPSPYSLYFEKLKLESGLSPAEEDAYFELKEELAGFYGDKDDYPAYRLLGYSDNLQGDMQLQCELWSRGVSLSGIHEEKLLEWAKDGQQWLHLSAEGSEGSHIVTSFEDVKRVVIPAGELQDSGYHRAAELVDATLQWVLLLQLDSDNDKNMMWGDCGRLYFWIPRQALLARDFQQAWTILQC